MKYAQLVVGPAGSGKSTYCSALVKHGEATNRTIKVVNLDPAAEQFDYEPLVDIRELVSLQDVMDDEEMKFGPNGGLIFCMEYLIKNTEWLQEQLGDYDDEYILFDCPGQIELYTHMSVMKDFCELLLTMDFRVCSVFILDSQFVMDIAKFFSGVLVALSTTINLEVPSVNILSKVDLLNKQEKRQLDKFLEPFVDLLDEDPIATSRHGKKFEALSTALAKLVDDYSLIKFFPMNINDEESISDILSTVDNAIQYGEDADVKIRDFDEEFEENDRGDG